MAGPWRGRPVSAAGVAGAMLYGGPGPGLTGEGTILNIQRLMSAGAPVVQVPETLDAWKMVAARRQFEGRLPLSALPRLRGSLADVEGECGFSLEFGQDALKVPFIELSV